MNGRHPKKSGRADKKHTPGALEADREYFARAMADVVRLPADPRGRVRATPHAYAPTESRESGAGQDDEDSSEAGFVASGVDRRELRKLRRGEHEPGSRLDLHGMTAADAVACVNRFIDSGHRRYRCVCIVHGRGLHSPGNVSTLRTRVRECLRRHWAVLAYADAPRTDGGSGAVYVLLRRS